MTFCLAMKVEEGIVAIADTRLTSGAEVTTARKVSIVEHGRHSMFFMCSGLRSVRDKVLTYFQEALEESDADFDRLYKAVNAFAEQVRRAETEDRAALEKANLAFNLFTLVGGQLENDREETLYLLYPAANWVEVAQGTPYFVIGEPSYGKPLLDRALRYDSTLEQALKIGFLAFDATRTSSTAVAFPLDVVIYRRGSYRMHEHRYERDELGDVSRWWDENLRALIDRIPAEWAASALTAPSEATVRSLAERHREP